jgi:cation transport ATPase
MGVRPYTAGDSVSAGTVNCDGALTVEVVSSGEETQVAGIVRMVEAAQQREAPVQRLADQVSGKFVYGRGVHSSICSLNLPSLSLESHTRLVSHTKFLSLS